MPMIPAQPDDGPAATGTTTVAVDGGWAQAWAQIEQALHAIPVPAWYITAGLVIVAGLLASVRIALAGKKNTRRRRSDKVLTFLAAAVATGVVATGMWKFFGDVLHITNPVGRTALFAFFEIAMLASAFRSRRFRLDRAAKRDVDPDDPDPRIDVDGIAVWVLATLSGLFASADEPTVTGKLVRIVAPLLAAWMWERGLAGELMQFTRGAKHINWALTPERILVWLGAADPSGRQIGEVARKRRVAKFSRTAYRLQIMKEDAAFKWRIGWVRWRLRRLTESANEHLNLATDRALLGEVRAQLALLYGVEDGTSRKAVADLHPLQPAEQLAISDRAFEAAVEAPSVPEVDDVVGDPEDASEVANEPAWIVASPGFPEMVGRDDKTFAMHPAFKAAREDATKAATETATNGPRKPASRRASKQVTDGVHPTAVRLAKYLAKYPAETNVELAKRMRVGDRTVSRYRAEAEAFNLANPQSDDDKERHLMAPPIPAPFDLPGKPVRAGVNGHSHTTPEES